ncbi:hypothetical protein HYPSUDRAFT_44020 [Hypholoma sublateritium FD-334 SS-4]|uniref:glutathione transferase n=1 Tax=Hypholoma sublateritium (strain FD-334 SS-4) TaxID=945553 RepID=A0A0D2NT42_HYPSF|nr:hypothetical protein HYPSUDRAFT_44020 [Hypholoma sublateritium FD-334 SS-4]
MVLKLYGFHRDTCTPRVALILREKNVPFEFINVDLTKREQKSPEYMKHQPFGSTPYIDDDGFILFESRAICYYIASKYADQGTPLIPTELKANALFHQAVSMEVTSFNEHVEKIVAEKVWKRFRGETADEANYERHLALLDSKLDVYDGILSKQKYLSGNEITLADLYHIPYGAMLAVGGTDIMEAKPNVKRWWIDITSRPSWVAVKKDLIKLSEDGKW